MRLCPSTIEENDIISLFEIICSHKIYQTQHGFASVNRVKQDSFGFSREEIITSLALQPDGKIIVCGLSYSSAGPDTNSDFLVARFNSNGSFDTIFGGAW